MIEVKNLTKTFKQKNGETFNAVDNVSFEVNKGEIVVLLGVNGAGKTTTMRMLSTVLKPNSGTVVIEGYDTLLQPQSVRANLGFLSGDTGLYARLTGREIIAYFGRLYDVDDKTIKNRIDYLSELLDMNDFLDKKSDMLSTGMKQKISIARSIIHDPPVMIFDEPTSGLDILTAKNIIDFVADKELTENEINEILKVSKAIEGVINPLILIVATKVVIEGRDIRGKSPIDVVWDHLQNTMFAEDLGKKMHCAVDYIALVKEIDADDLDNICDFDEYDCDDYRVKLSKWYVRENNEKLSIIPELFNDVIFIKRFLENDDPLKGFKKRIKKVKKINEKYLLGVSINIANAYEFDKYKDICKEFAEELLKIVDDAEVYSDALLNLVFAGISIEILIMIS